MLDAAVCERVLKLYSAVQFLGDGEPVCGDSDLREVEGRRLPDDYLAMLHSPDLCLPGTWDFLGMGDRSDYLVRENEELNRAGHLPEGWLAFANVADDSWYFFSGLSSDPVANAEVWLMDPQDFPDIARRAVRFVPSFQSLLLAQITCETRGWEDVPSRVREETEALRTLFGESD